VQFTTFDFSLTCCVDEHSSHRDREHEQDDGNLHNVDEYDYNLGYNQGQNYGHTRYDAHNGRKCNRNAHGEHARMRGSQREYGDDGKPQYMLIVITDTLS
jgi:hypothetical protein